jgi:hypothetical protein
MRKKRGPSKKNVSKEKEKRFMISRNKGNN